MGGEGKILVFNGFYSVPLCKIRYDQLKYVLENFPNMEVIEPELRDVIPNTVQSAHSDVTDMLTKHGEDSGLKAVWACWDVPMVGATQAIEAAGRAGVKTYGVDGSPEYVEMVADPESPAAAVAAQQPYEIGKQAVQNVARYLGGQDVPPFSFVPAVLINKENAAIEMRGIDKAFGPVRALIDADLVVEPGTIHGLVGQNGANKSTIIKVLAGIYKPDAGGIKVSGQDVSSPTPAGIEALDVHFIQQKVAVAKWLSCQSKVYLLDEPTVAVDVGAKVVFFSISAEGFLSLQNFINLTVNKVILLAIIALGMTIVIASGGIDLSVGVSVDMSSMVFIMLLAAGFSGVLGIAGGLGAALCVGLLNALLINRLNINPFLATLGILFVGQSTQQLASRGGQPIYLTRAELRSHLQDRPPWHPHAGRGAHRLRCRRLSGTASRRLRPLRASTRRPARRRLVFRRTCPCSSPSSTWPRPSFRASPAFFFRRRSNPTCRSPATPICSMRSVRLSSARRSAPTAARACSARCLVCFCWR